LVNGFGERKLSLEVSPDDPRTAGRREGGHLLAAVLRRRARRLWHIIHDVRIPRLKTGGKHKRRAG
jgi:hypothetical protein